MRKVQVFKSVFHTSKWVDGKHVPSHTEKELLGEATFHQFGSDFEEFEAGPGNYTTAVIEWPDGTVDNVPVSNVRFLDKGERNAE